MRADKLVFALSFFIGERCRRLKHLFLLLKASDKGGERIVNYALVSRNFIFLFYSLYPSG